MTYHFNNIFEFQEFCGQKYFCGTQYTEKNGNRCGSVYTDGMNPVGEWYSTGLKYTIIIY